MKRIKNIFSLFNNAFGAYKLQITALAVIGFLSGILEGIGANALIPLFSFITGEGGGGNDFISQTIEKAFLFLNIDFGIKYLLVFIALLFVLKAFVLFIAGYMQVKITTSYEKNMRVALFKKTLNARWPYLMHQKIGYLEKVFSMDVKKATVTLKSLGSLVIIITGFLMYLLIALNISVSMSLITIALGGALFLALSPFMVQLKKLADKTGDRSRVIAHFVNEIVLGLKTYKATSTGKNVAEYANKHFSYLRDLQLSSGLKNNILPVVFQPVSIIFIMLVFAFSYKTSSFNIAAFIAIIYLIQRMFTHVQQFQSNITKIMESVPYVENMMRYDTSTERNKETLKGNEQFVFKDRLEFKNVSFAYDKNKEVLSGINFSINKGEFMGVVGPSGVGKTTVVDLILRLFTPVGGSITLDGKDISGVDMEEWRKNVGYVSQDIYMMNDTIENNIAFYNPNISLKEIRAAARDSNILTFIERLPKGFNTVVGERGVLLSAGQRQRIVIARVLARQPQFLILDEATSALDNESEAQIQKVIEGLKGKITVLVIAHRLGTVMNCDNLLILESGKVAEGGNPKTLLKDKESYFYKVYNIRK
jgi:ATP-binding cassette, subfamily B, bacterial MsbA